MTVPRNFHVQIFFSRIESLFFVSEKMSKNQIIHETNVHPVYMSKCVHLISSYWTWLAKMISEKNFTVYLQHCLHILIVFHLLCFLLSNQYLFFTAVFHVFSGLPCKIRTTWQQADSGWNDFNCWKYQDMNTQLVQWAYPSTQDSFCMALGINVLFEVHVQTLATYKKKCVHERVFFFVCFFSEAHENLKWFLHGFVLYLVNWAAII